MTLPSEPINHGGFISLVELNASSIHVRSLEPTNPNPTNRTV
jgi:hypothetical protein